MEDVSKKYVSCPKCKIPIVSKGLVVEDNVSVVRSDRLFSSKIIGMKGHIDRQCPKCYKVWRDEYKN